MKPGPLRDGASYVEAIRASGLTIYDMLPKDSSLFVPTKALETILDHALRGFSTAGLALRTRSKVVKSEVCRCLGYPVPTSFRKCKPHARFPAQNFDTYVQASNNLQVWNEELSPRRRYVLISVDAEGLIDRVKVITGAMLAKLDTTGTLTQKYQARFVASERPLELVTSSDTSHVLPWLASPTAHFSVSPTSDPQVGQLLSIQELFTRLGTLLGRVFADAGNDQERLRGADLHRLVCEVLGYSSYADDGQFPDIRHQLLEVKLQTAPTIDLGLIEPASTEFVDLDSMPDDIIRHCDVRYAIFGAVKEGPKVRITSLVLTTGEAFFSRFPRCEGRVLNKKLQIPLPSDFFTKTKR